METLQSLQQTEFFAWVVLPLLIFLARIADQTIGTLRLIFLSKGFSFLAPLLGFFEVIIWLVAVSQIMKHLDNVMCYIAYGAGFAMGNYLGILLDRKLSIGKVLLRIILKQDNPGLTVALQSENFGLTLLDAEGGRGHVRIMISILNRKDLKRFLGLLESYEPEAFYTIEDVKTTREGIFPSQGRKGIFHSHAFRLMKSK